jgi:inner membrane protein
VDSITQAALGGVVGELVLGRKLGWKGMAWGLFFGTLPDLDILVYPWLDQAEKLRWHRGISHSIAMMLVASFTFAKPLSLLHRKKGVSAKRAGWFVFLAWSTHVLIDVFTSYGTQVFEPFSDQRVAWSNIFIIDLFFTLPLFIGRGSASYTSLNGYAGGGEIKIQRRSQTFLLFQRAVRRWPFLQPVSMWFSVL